MTRIFRTGFGLVASATLLAGCAMAPQPETITLPNPLAALNGVIAPPRAQAPVYQQAAPIYQQAAPASYNTYSPGYSVPAPTYSTVSPSYSSAAPIASTLPAPTVINTSPLSTQQVVAPDYSLPVDVTTTSQTYTSASLPQSSPYTLGSVGTAPTLSTPTLGSVQPLPAIQPVQASGTTYDLTAGSAYGATLAPMPTIDVAPEMGGAFQVVPPAAPSLGGGVVTYSPAQPALGGTLSY